MKKLLLILNFALGISAHAETAVEAWSRRYSNLVDSNDQASRVVTDNAGNVIVAGSSDEGLTGPDIVIIKYSNVGVPLWTNHYNGPGNGSDWPASLAIDGGGNVIVSGYSEGIGSGLDYVTLKYSSGGPALWTNRYNGPGNDNDYASATAIDPSGNVIVTGYSVGIGTDDDYATIKYSSAGVPIWTNRYNGPGNANDDARAIALDSSGNVFVTGKSWSGSSDDFATIAYSSTGATLWVNRYNGPGNDSDEAYALAVAGGNVFVTGYSYNTNLDQDYLTIAYSTAGLPLWTNRYHGPGTGGDVAQAIAVGGSNVFVTGYSDSLTANRDYVSIAYSTAGVPLWTNRYNGPGNSVDEPVSLAVDNSANVIVTGHSYDPDSYDYATIKYSSSGTVLWVNRYNGPPGDGDDNAQSVAVDGSGNVFVTGPSYSGSSYDWATIKYASSGVASWTNRYNGLSRSDGQPNAVAVDASGNIFVTGFSSANGGGNNYATIKYASNGVPVWTNRYAGSALNGFVDDQAQAIVVDGSGNVFVTGYSRSDTFDNDYATIKYSSAGVPLWTNRYNAPAYGDDNALAMALDGSGNVIVTGYSISTNGDYDYATIKYSSAGVPIWTNNYDGPTNQNDEALAIATDPSGNVIVTGFSSSETSYYDYATIKYSSSGVPLWTNRYDGGSSGADFAQALAVDSNGNVIVTGYSTSTNGDNDYATIKYSGAGVALWTNRYNAPGNGDDYAQALTVDSSGNVYVTGYSTGTNGYDYATIEYSSAGVPLWTNRYDGAGQGSDYADAIALDGSGRVFVTGYSSSASSYDFATIAYSTSGTPLWTNRFSGPGNGNDQPVTSRSLAAAGNGSLVVVGVSELMGHNDFATAKYITVPLLTARRTATNTVAISWPSASTGFNLQQNTNLPGTNWSLVGSTPSDDGTNKTFIVNPPVGKKFFRLAYP